MEPEDKVETFDWLLLVIFFLEETEDGVEFFVTSIAMSSVLVEESTKKLVDKVEFSLMVSMFTSPMQLVESTKELRERLVFSMMVSMVTSSLQVVESAKEDR